MMCGLTVLGIFVGVLVFGACEITHLRKRNIKIANQIRVSRNNATNRVITTQDSFYGSSARSSFNDD